MKLYYLIGYVLRPFAVVGFYLFSVLTRTPRVRVVVRNEKNELLLVQTWLSGGTWGLPGGGVNRGESFEKAAQRELREETSISAEVSELQQLSTIHSRGHKEVVFSLRVQGGALPASPTHKFEVKAVEWFPPGNTPTLDSLAREIVHQVAKKG